jgi:hypothetical protein
MLKGQRNSRKQGDVGLGVAIGWFAAQGWTVCVPLTDSQDFDLVVENGDGLQMVQVKTTYHPEGSGYAVDLRTHGGNRSGTGKVKKFDPSAVDFLFVLTEKGDRYLIPSADVGGRTGIVVGKQKYEPFRV